MNPMAKFTNRFQRLRWLQTPEGRRSAALTSSKRRGNGDHRFVVGAFVLDQGRVVLRCVRCGPAYDVPRPPELTDDARRFNRWRTKQAAHQFAVRWNLIDCHVIDLEWLDVLTPGQVAGVSADPLTSGQAAGG